MHPQASAMRSVAARWAVAPEHDQVRRVATTEGAFHSYVYNSHNPEDVSFYLVVPGERLIFEIWCKV
jgi:hypothetical protein